MDLLYTENVSKSFGNFWALKDINIRVPEKSIFGLLGPNGAGKTTLIRIITQIIFADSGKIFIDQKEINADHVKQIGYLPEERGLYKKMKVGEHLVYLARLKDLTASQSVEKIRYWMKKFEMDDWWNKKVEDLSKGMQQKVQFIATILHDPRLIILDEPFSGFDPINANLIRDEILELRNKGATIIFSTHRMESVEELCDSIALINKSRVILEGSKKEIKKEYRTNTFIVEHSNDFSSPNGRFEILEKNKADVDMFRSVIRIPDGKNPNELLSALMEETEIHSFIEKIPSMNDIFIHKVKEKQNE